jgi:hypothetical protein
MAASTRAIKVKRMGLLATLVLTGVNPSAHAAGRVFHDDFESGDTVAKWGTVGSGNNCKAVRSSVDGVAPHGGAYHAECNWNGTLSWQNPLRYSALELKSWDYRREFFIRLWVRYSADVDKVGGNKLLRLYPGNDSFYVAGQMERPGGPLFIYFESMAGRNGPISYGDGTVFGDGKWRKLEIYIKDNNSGASDGIVRVWRDGVLQVEGVNVVSVTPGQKWSNLNLMSNWSSNPGWEHDASNHVYWDNVEVFTDTGSGATGNMSDATIRVSGTAAPQPPQALSVR